MPARTYGQDCGLVAALELIGERWALLLVRELLGGSRRYSDLKTALPRIPTNILSDRLRELQHGGVLRRVPRVRGGYELTDLGRRLDPIVLALTRWGHDAGSVDLQQGPLSADAVALELRAAFDPDAAAGVPATVYVLHTDGVAVAVRVDAHTVAVLPVDGALPEPLAAQRDALITDADAVMRTESGLRRVLERRPCDAAIDILHVTHGDPTLATRFHATFHA